MDEKDFDILKGEFELIKMNLKDARCIIWDYRKKMCFPKSTFLYIMLMVFMIGVGISLLICSGIDMYYCPKVIVPEKVCVEGNVYQKVPALVVKTDLAGNIEKCGIEDNKNANN